jgi:hypothetical protein
MQVYGFAFPVVAGQPLVELPGGGDDRWPKRPIRDPPRKPYRPGKDVPEPVPIDDPKPPKPKDLSDRNLETSN